MYNQISKIRFFRKLLLKKFSFLCLVFVLLAVLFSSVAIADGISVDSGLTPAQARWIIRTQFRYMQRINDPTSMNREMTTYAFPIVIAYGLRSNLTLMARQIVMQKLMKMSGSQNKDNGLSDLFLLCKYKAYRYNTDKRTFGIAGTFGLKIPSGTASLSSKSYDLKFGVYMTGRAGSWSADFDVAYFWNSVTSTGKNNKNFGNEISLDWALAHQISIGENANFSIAPVIELSFKKISATRLSGDTVSNSGESVLFISPGIKSTFSSFILEFLAQIPVYQNQNGSQLQHGPLLIFGTRFMF